LTLQRILTDYLSERGGFALIVGFTVAGIAQTKPYHRNHKCSTNIQPAKAFEQ